MSHPRKKHIPELDGLRGIAAFAVIVSHSSNEGFLPSFLGYGLGQQGVALFYVLSAYLIFHLYLDRTFTRENLVQYVLARTARVLPLFYATLLVAGLVLVTLGAAVYDFQTMPQFLGNLFLVQGTSVLWSIPVEVQFYVLFIGVWWLYTLTNSRWAILAFIVIQGALFVSFNSGVKSLPYWLHFFAVGGTVAVLRIKPRIPKWVGVVTLCLLPLALPQVRRMMGVPVFPNYYDPITAGYPILVFILVVHGAPAFRFLAHPWLRHLGQISFAAYLFHWPLILCASELGLGGIFAFAFVVIATLIFATLSLHYFERPAQRALRNPQRFARLRAAQPSPGDG